MKVYFTAALSQMEEYGPIYQRIIEFLEKTGWKVLHHNMAQTSLKKVRQSTDEETEKHYKKVQQYIAVSDLVVVEASFPSTLNIGHEITLGLERGKPVIVLYQKGKRSMFFSGLKSEKLLLTAYTVDKIENTLEKAIEQAQETADARFNFFISPRHISFLDWIARTKRIPRSVYLRTLIEKDKQINTEYLASL